MSLRGKFVLSMLAFILLVVLSAWTVQSAALAGPTTPIPPGPKPTPTRPVTATPTLAPTPTILYYQPSDRYYYPPQTPTPLAPPPASSDRLQPWTEARALELVRKIVIDAHDREVPGPSGGRPGLAAANDVVRLSALEALYRYPQSKDAAALGWRVALSNTILGSKDSDRWITAQIAEILNRRLAVLENLNQYLARFGFRARVGVDPVANVFNDGRAGQVLIVETADETGGLFVLVTKTTQGQYQCIPLASIWGAHWYFELSAQEENFLGDGLPVIVTQAASYSGTMSSVSMGLFRWNGKEMVDIGQGRIRSTGIGATSFEASFLPGGGLKVSDPQMGIGIREISYQWDGQQLNLISDRYDLSGEWYDGKFYAYSAALDQGDYADLETSLAANLNDKQLLDNGPSAPDFLRFLLAEAQAMEGKADQARQTLQTVANSTADPAHPALRRAAQVFLENANTPAGWLRGCLSANQLISWYVDAYPAYSSSLPSIQNKLFGHNLGYYLPCHAGPFFQNYLMNLSGAQVGEPVKALTDAGIRLRYSGRSDEPGEADKIWLVQLETYLYSYQPEYWVIVSHSDHVRAAQFNGSRNSLTTPVSIRRIQLNDSNQPTYMMINPDWFTLFRIDTSNRVPVIETLINQVNGDFQADFDPRDTPPVIQLNDSSSCTPRRRVYVWNEDLKKYTSRDAADWLFFTQHQPVEAQAAIKQILPLVLQKPDNPDCQDFHHLEAARLTYLLALSQELSGDPSAAGSYAAVWRGYPDTGYALMAKAKLVP